MPDATEEITSGERFAFGKNWRRFATTIDDETVEEAKASLRQMLGVEDLHGKTFLDIGSGSGLFSLAANQLGATVTSFDYDPDSVRCTEDLRARFGTGQQTWKTLTGSVLDDQFMTSLGDFDVVYSWGVLHHTGDLWTALDAAADRVRTDGYLSIAIYNDQGAPTRVWRRVKQMYNRRGPVARSAILVAAFLRFESQRVLVAGLKRLLGMSARTAPGSARGMNRWTDLVDWVGGWPFEVARPDEVFDHLRQRGFVLEKLVTMAGGFGCNEFVFSRATEQT